MNAIAVNPSKKEVGLVDHPAPELVHEDDVKFRMLEVGICGTDREICRFDYGNPPAGFEHLVLGHEGLGEVVEVGSKVTTLKPGDLVVPLVRRPCADTACEPCRNGRSDFCVTGDFAERGIKDVHGIMTECVVDREEFLCKVPEHLREVAVMMEPLSVAEKALEQICRIQQRVPWKAGRSVDDFSGEGQRAVVLGAGPIGILGAMAFKVAGFDTYVYSRSKAPNPKADIIESLGIPYISALETSPTELAERVGNIDVVYEAIGQAKAAFEVLEVLGQNGTFVFTGIPGFPLPKEDIDASLIMRRMVLKNQVLVGTVNASRLTFEWSVRDMEEFMRRWPDALKSVISGRHPLDNARSLLLDKATGIKNVLKLS